VAEADLGLRKLTAVADLDDALVTALVPLKTYDAQYLAEALDSIVAQTRPTWRMFVIVDPEDVRELTRVVQPWLADARIQLARNEGARLAGAINTGMRRATTDHVAILLADDAWSPRAVAVLEDRIRAAPHVDFFHSARVIVNDDGTAISSVHRPRDAVTLADFFVGAPVKHLLCWRRTMGLAIGGLDERSPSHGPDDFDFPWTMAEHGAIFESIADCLYIYRDHRRIPRLSTHMPRRVAERELYRIYRKHGMARRDARARVAHDRHAHLRQNLFRNRLDARLRLRFGQTPVAWRDTYR
jgi:glycosyltransferase involved in cell wall biosynthesis